MARWLAVVIIFVVLLQVPSSRAENFEPTLVLDFGTYMADVVIDDGRNLAYVSARDRDSVLVLSLSDISTVDEIPVGDGPMGMDMDRSTDRLYVTLSNGSGGIAVVDLTSRTVAETWPLPLSFGAADVVVGRPGRIYVSGSGISAHDTTNGSSVWWTNALQSVLAISPDFRYLYAAGLYSYPSTVTKLDVETDSPIWVASNTDTNSLANMALSPDGTRLYLAARYTVDGGSGMAVLDTGTMTISGSVPSSEATAVTVSPDSSRVIAGSGVVYAYDRSTGVILDSFGGPYGYARAIRLDFLGKHVFISQTDYNQSERNRLLVYSWAYAKPPTIDVLSPPPDSSSTATNATLSVRITDTNGVDPLSIRMKLDGTDLSLTWDPNANVATASVTGLAPGRHAAEARASNLAGIGPRVVNWTFAVDHENPWSRIRTLQPTQQTWTLVIVAEGFDNLSAIQDIVLYYRLNGGGWALRGPGTPALGGSGTLRVWAIPVNETGGAGFYEFYAIASDAVGNREEKSPHAEASVRVTVPPDPIGDLFRWTLVTALVGILSALGLSVLELWRLRLPATRQDESVISRQERTNRRHAAVARTFTATAIPLHVASIGISVYAIKVIAEVVAGRTIGWGEFSNALARSGLVILVLIGIAVQAAFAAMATMATVWFHARRFQLAPVAVVSGAIAIVLSFLLLGGVVGAAAGALTVVGGVLAALRPSPPSPFAYPPPLAPP